MNRNVKILCGRLYSPSLKGVAWLEDVQLIFTDLPTPGKGKSEELFLSVENFLPVKKFLADREFFYVVEIFVERMDENFLGVAGVFLTQGGM